MQDSTQQNWQNTPVTPRQGSGTEPVAPAYSPQQNPQVREPLVQTEFTQQQAPQPQPNQTEPPIVQNQSFQRDNEQTPSVTQQPPVESSSPPIQNATPDNNPIAEQDQLPDFDSMTDEEYAAYVQQANMGYFPTVPKVPVEELVYGWEAPSRPFKIRSKEFYKTMLLIAAFLCVILATVGQILVVLVIVAVVFLFYVLSTIPPSVIITQFTTYGVRQEDQLYFWEELGRFWLDTIHDQRVVHIEVARFPNRLTLLVGKGDEALITEMLSEILLQQKPAPTLYEKIAAWLKEKIPLDVEN